MLIVEDSPPDAQLMASVLEQGGFRVQFEAVDSADNFRERLAEAEYDVILADFNLGSWTVFDALEILKRSRRDIPLVVVTGAVGDEAAAECLKEGAADYVLKDRPSRLPAAVQRVLEEKRLRAENQKVFVAVSRLATIVESSDDAIIGKTLEGLITSWNKGAEALYGYIAADVVGRPISILVPPERSEELPRILARLRRGERVEHFESVRVRKDGSFVDVSLSVFPLTGPDGEVMGAASIARDITERKRAEAGTPPGEPRPSNDQRSAIKSSCVPRKNRICWRIFAGFWCVRAATGWPGWAMQKTMKASQYAPWPMPDSRKGTCKQRTSPGRIRNAGAGPRGQRSARENL